MAIVGQTGLGKTTIARLLQRFYDPDQGRITVDGQDIRDVTFESLRRNIGIVAQDTSLFNLTLRENVLFGTPEGSALDEAIHFAALERTIERLTGGLDARVGERGSMLSGGERQRVAIARTLLLNPKILILDEATSSLDSKTEADIIMRLELLVKGRTTIIIAHRLTTVRHAERILILGSNGAIIESGSHSELLSLGGRYAELWQMNMKGKEILQGGHPY